MVGLVVTYSLDTSALIEPWTRRYPPDVFPGVWSWLEARISIGEVRAIDEVRTELERQDDALLAWCRVQANLFAVPDDAVQSALVDVLRKFPTMADHERDRSVADPWVVAHALAKGLTLVTYEQMGKQARPKIPNACAHFGIRVASMVDLLRETGFNPAARPDADLAEPALR